MPRFKKDERIELISHIVADGARFSDVLPDVLHGMERNSPGIVGPIRVNLVRRLSATEIVRLRLEPETGTWFEVCGDAARKS
jgi:hypothetical protein